MALVFIVQNIFYGMTWELMLRIVRKDYRLCEACPIFMNQILSKTTTISLCVIHALAEDMVPWHWPGLQFLMQGFMTFFSFLEATAVLIYYQTTNVPWYLPGRMWYGSLSTDRVITVYFSLGNNHVNKQIYHLEQLVYWNCKSGKRV